MTKKGCLVVLTCLLITGAVNAQMITIRGGLALSYMSSGTGSISGIGGYEIEGAIGIGGNVSLDYVLLNMLSIPLSLGLEVGINGAISTVYVTQTYWVTEGANEIRFPYEESMLAIPILLRLGYHFIYTEKLDLYLVGKIGYSVGSWKGGAYDALKVLGGSIGIPNGFAFGVDLGISYYFTQILGIFAEAGFDDYMLSTDISIASYSTTFESPFYRFLTLGLSLRF